jgi:hypothetical protein
MTVRRELIETAHQAFFMALLLTGSPERAVQPSLTASPPWISTAGG